MDAQSRYHAVLAGIGTFDCANKARVFIGIAIVPLLQPLYKGSHPIASTLDSRVANTGVFETSVSRHPGSLGACPNRCSSCFRSRTSAAMHLLLQPDLDQGLIRNVSRIGGDLDRVQQVFRQPQRDRLRRRLEIGERCRPQPCSSQGTPPNPSSPRMLSRLLHWRTQEWSLGACS